MTPVKVLVVEDEALLAMTLEDWLRDWGFEVVGPAMTLAAATELATSAPIDAAILDVNVGGKASFDIARLLWDRAIPYIFATGYGSVIEEAAGPGTAVVHKPYRSEELREAIDIVLNGGRRERPPAAG